MSVQLKHEAYDAAKMNLLQRQVMNAREQGQPIDYEISVDGFVVVPRNNDPARFNSYADCISADTKNITIGLYRGNGFEKYFFSIETPGSKKQEGLGELPGGLSLSDWEEQQKEKWKRDLRYDELEKQNGELLKQVGEKDKALEELAEKYKELQEKKMLSLGEIGAGLLTGALNHPFVKEKISAFTGLSGQPPMQQEEDISFKRKDGSQKTEEKIAVALSDEEEGYVQLLRDLEERTNQAQLNNVMYIVGQLVDNPSAIGSTLKHIANFLNSKPREESNEKV